jgi:hypothetical protein
MMNNENIPMELEALTAAQPEEEYKKQVEEEDPEKLAEVRKKLMLLITVKCKSVGPLVIQGQIKPMVYQANIKDCENMIEMIRKKGIKGLYAMIKKENKMVQKR